MKSLLLLLGIFCATLAHASSEDQDATIQPSEVAKNNLINAFGPVLMPGLHIKDVSSISDTSITFSVAELDSPRGRQSVITYTCDIRTTNGGRDILIPGCEGARSLNGKPDNSGSTPTLASVAKRGENTLRLKNILDADNKFDKAKLAEMGKKLGMSAEDLKNANFRNCVIEPTCADILLKRFGHRATPEAPAGSANTDGQKDD